MKIYICKGNNQDECGIIASVYLLKKGYINNAICSCVFIKRTKMEFIGIVFYVNNLIIGTSIELDKIISYLKKEFEMKNLGKTKLCPEFQVEYLSKEIFVQQSSYIEKILKPFIMDKAYPMSTPMIVPSLKKRFVPP